MQHAISGAYVACSVCAERIASTRRDEMSRYALNTMRYSSAHYGQDGLSRPGEDAIYYA